MDKIGYRKVGNSSQRLKPLGFLAINFMNKQAIGYYGEGLKNIVAASVFDKVCINIMYPVRFGGSYNTQIRNLFTESNWILWPSIQKKKILLTLKK